MDSLLLIAREADKKKKPHCAMAKTAGELQSAIVNIGQSIYSLKSDVKQAQEAALIAADAATKAANKKPPKPTKQDYVMDVVRDDAGLIMRIDVSAV